MEIVIGTNQLEEARVISVLVVLLVVVVVPVMEPWLSSVSQAASAGLFKLSETACLDYDQSDMHTTEAESQPTPRGERGDSEHSQCPGVVRLFSGG